MADKHIGALPAVPYVYDDTLLAAEQQGVAVKITARQLRGQSSAGSSGSGSGSGTGGGLGGGFVEMETSIPVESRTGNTLYGLILEKYG